MDIFNDVKRRRISPGSNGTALFDLPNEALSYAASYLASPSRAMFAIAFFRYGASVNDRSNDASTAILSSEQFDILDFGEIEANLAAKVTDDLLKAILLFINAHRNLKKIKLTGCVNITGVGLIPLCGSVALEQIDLSLVGEHKSPVLDPKPLLSDDHVLPILDSIIDRHTNGLRSIVFPKSWRENSQNAVLNYFMRRCNQMFERRNITCTKCDELVEDSTTLLWFPIEGRNYGLQSYSCYNCVKHFCYNCMDDDENGGLLLKFCKICEQEYCYECSSTVTCMNCEEDYCKECRSMEDCGGCGDKCCSECIKNCGSLYRGHPCSLKFCGGCADEREKCHLCRLPFCTVCSIVVCSSCNQGYCGSCRGSNKATCCDQCP